ncbi:MAG: DUF4832 domain-containing protein [Chitinophagales bacterium]|nr:DUF4832 domain-containing protein [Chitinophagales bacterium]
MLKTSLNILYFTLLISSLLVAQNTSTLSFVESSEIFSNPERGFSVYRGSPVTVSLINNLKPYHVSVVQRIYTIPQFINSPLSDDFLNTVRNDLDAAREGGAKLVMRFSYTNNQNGADAPLSIILQQIEQLKPILQVNSDVIAYLEAGFIGAWGEWYYSTNKLNNTNDRRSVLFGLLDALPTDRAVVVRTPEYKRQIFNDINPIKLAEAFNGSNKSRTGAHNDCFLASSTDYGTYVDNDIEGDKDYLNQDNMFVPQGGETCNPSAFSGCNIAPVDLARMHWSILNRDYHPTVLDGWKSEGCYDDVQRNLGYRFVLLNGEITNAVKPGGEFNINLTIANRGYASPFNPRNLEFVLRNKETKKKYRLVTNEDPRLWFSGDSVNIEITGGILENMQEGNYELLLHLADPEIKLHDRPEYSIQLANENVWEDSTGYNLINGNVDISSSISGENYTGNSFFNLITNNNVDTSSSKIDGFFDDWNSTPKLNVNPNNESKGDAANPSADIIDVWVKEDESNLYISYSLDSSFSDQYFYHVFFDTDSDTSTGFHSGESYAGIDLMIENDLMWKYTGVNGEWSWASSGSFYSSIGVEDDKRIEIAISKNILSNLGATEGINFILNVNDNNDNIVDDYAPDEYKTRSFSYSFLITSVKNEVDLIPNKIEIDAYPNPFNNSVNISFSMDPSKIESANIFDSLGKVVQSYNYDEIKNQKITWDGKNNLGNSVVSGVYFFSLKTEKNINSKKLVLLK